MRLLGMFLLGFGIYAIIVMAIGLISARKAPIIAVWCLIVLVPVMCVGVKLIRNTEDLSANGEHQKVHECVKPPFGALWSRIATFDLNRLNVFGWGLLLATYGVLISECGLLVLIADRLGWQEERLAFILALPMFLGACGFFWAVQAALRAIGINVTRRKKKGDGARYDEFR